MFQLPLFNRHRTADTALPGAAAVPEKARLVVLLATVTLPDGDEIDTVGVPTATGV